MFIISKLAFLQLRKVLDFFSAFEHRRIILNDSKLLSLKAGIWVTWPETHRGGLAALCCSARGHGFKYQPRRPHFGGDEMQSRPCAVHRGHVKDPLAVKANPKSPTTASLVIKSWFSHIKPQHSVQLWYEVNKMRREQQVENVSAKWRCPCRLFYYLR